jgi:hypothetical protein
MMKLVIVISEIIREISKDYTHKYGFHFPFIFHVAWELYDHLAKKIKYLILSIKHLPSSNFVHNDVLIKQLCHPIFGRYPIRRAFRSTSSSYV